MVVVMRRDSIALERGPASPCVGANRTIALSYGACEMTTREGAAKDFSNLFAVGVPDIEPRNESVEHASIGGYDALDRLVRHVEHQLITPNACLPEPRQVFRSLDGPRMQESIATGRVRRHREVVTGRIRQCDVRVPLHTEIATGRGLTIKGGREHA